MAEYDDAKKRGRRCEAQDRQLKRGLLSARVITKKEI